MLRRMVMVPGASEGAVAGLLASVVMDGGSDCRRKLGCGVMGGVKSISAGGNKPSPVSCVIAGMFGGPARRTLLLMTSPPLFRASV